MEPTKTQIVLAEMLVENTGSHMLDSGGAYGRNWEKAKGKTVEDFIAEPVVATDKYSGPIISIFHYCDSWLEFDEEFDAKFNHWVEVNDDENSPWLVLMEEFSNRYEKSYASGTFNSYNSENILSQTIQYTVFQEEDFGDEYCLLQIHGGCDVRGGYTKPRVFRIMEEGFGWDADSFTIVTCDDREGDAVTIDYRGGELTHIEWENAWPERDKVPVIDCDEWTRWWDNDSPIEWDEEVGKFTCPDGDGHFTFDANFY